MNRHTCRNSNIPLRQKGIEVFDRLFQTGDELDVRLPVEVRAGQRNIRPALLRIVSEAILLWRRDQANFGIGTLESFRS
jgi:hypothetical protein